MMWVLPDKSIERKHFLWSVNNFVGENKNDFKVIVVIPDKSIERKHFVALLPDLNFELISGDAEVVPNRLIRMV